MQRPDVDAEAPERLEAQLEATRLGLRVERELGVFSVTGPTVVLSEIVVESRPPPSTETPSCVAVTPEVELDARLLLPSDSFTNASASPVAITKALFFVAALI